MEILETPGYVYAIDDDRYYPDSEKNICPCFKIGRTEQLISRFMEIKGEQSFANKNFKIVFIVKLKNTSIMTKLETALHRKFKEYRVNTTKEWFQKKIKETAIDYIEQEFSNSYENSVILYKTDEEINSIYKKFDMNNALKKGKNPLTSRSCLKIKTRIQIIHTIISENDMTTGNDLIKKIPNYRKQDLLYDIKNGYLVH